jgi:putative glutamine amidotransferase
MKPLIGLNLDVSAGPPEQVELLTTYYEPIFAVGGIPVLLPPMPDDDLEEILGGLSGLVLIGGNDYSPRRYGQDLGPKTKLVHTKREDFDFRLLHRALKRAQMPILGICNGCQLINIGFGGSLIQDIPSELPDSQVKHRGEAGWKVKDWHEVELVGQSKLLNIYKKQRLSVPTAHHQGIGSVGNGLKASAHAEDGLVEALEAPDHPFIVGVQWHPERDFTGNEALFKEFLSKARATADKP